MRIPVEVELHSESGEVEVAGPSVEPVGQCAGGSDGGEDAGSAAGAAAEEASRYSQADPGSRNEKLESGVLGENRQLLLRSLLR